MEKGINQLESNFGHELMTKAEALFREGVKNGVASYTFSEKDWQFLAKDLQQLGFKKFLDESISEATFLISPQKLKIVNTERYGTFLAPPHLFLPKGKVMTNEKGEITTPAIKELGNTNGFGLILTAETNPNKENIFCQYQRLVLIINTYNNYLFIEENLLTTDDQSQKKMEEFEITAMKRPEKEIINLFQNILEKKLKKNLNY
ncbi:hypothetical protein MUP50_00100 [Patescibacteria group bacterium]|nr:hypothetical protein [Patescibacteria group bacterium]